MITGCINNYIRQATGDPFWEDTVLLVGPSNAAGSFNINDESFANHPDGTNLGGGTNGANVDNGVTLFGSNTMFFDSGLNDHFNFTDDPDWTLGSSEFCMEGFIYPNDNDVRIIPLAHYTTVGDERGWIVDINGTTGLFRFTGSTDGLATTTILSGAYEAERFIWHYWRVQRSAGNVFRSFAGPLGGMATLIDKQTNNFTFHNSTATLGINGTHQLVGCMWGYAGEIRITLADRYDSDDDFPVPVAKFPRG